MTLMILSIVLLWTAPFIYRAADQYAHLRRPIERLVMIAIGVLVVFSILPESYYVIGPWAIAIAGLGMLLPSLVERLWHRLADRIHWIPLILGTMGLAFHASIDGAAFVDAGHPHEHIHALPYAVLIHRAFEGMFLWFTLRPRFGFKWAAVALGVVSAFTALGYFAGDHYFHTFEADMAFHYFQALVAGSLLHLALDRHNSSHEDHDHHDHHHGHAH